MTDSEQIPQTIVLTASAVVAAGLVVWMACAWVQRLLDAHAAATYWHDHGQDEVRNQLAHVRAQDEKRQSLREFGITERELRMNHAVIRDPKTGMPTTIYHISPARMEALAAALMRRYIQTLTNSAE
ncbi:Uncharacterised protein [Mycobacteroides abscessus subsp. abscessus]|uniref:hypothetical protein n=1 Tax=Mycobacteroides abscessus TaxID=36809 RepID=UPI00092A4602|nr:hypothetical protein [Mycobacteroides abscessus]SHU27494.1 Uncharacterised protein [Mycobacteroides abscessus subsp. abscessus]